MLLLLSTSFSDSFTDSGASDYFEDGPDQAVADAIDQARIISVTTPRNATMKTWS